MLYILLYLLLSIATAFGFGQFFARRNAETRAAMLHLQLQDAIGVQLDQYEELERLRLALEAAVRDRNAANLRAARAVASLRALPAITARIKLPADLVHTIPFNPN